MCAPVHVGVEGNEMADKEEKQCLRRTEVELPVTISKEEARVIIKRNIPALWQNIEENQHRGRCLSARHRQVGSVEVGGSSTRQETGHKCLSHSLHLIQKRDTGICREIGGRRLLCSEH